MNVLCSVVISGGPWTDFCRESLLWGVWWSRPAIVLNWRLFRLSNGRPRLQVQFPLYLLLHAVEPLMVNHFFESNSFIGVFYQQTRYQIARFHWIAFPTLLIEHHIIFACHPDGLLLRVVIKWQWTGHKGIHDAAEWPKIDLEGVWLFAEDFWGNVAQSAEWFFGFDAGAYHFSQAKVDQFGDWLFCIIGHHDIF